MSAARAAARSRSVPQLLGDVQELVGFVRDDGLEFSGGVLVCLQIRP